MSDAKEETFEEKRISSLRAMMRNTAITEAEATIEHVVAPLSKATENETPQASIAVSDTPLPSNLTSVAFVQAQEPISSIGDSHSAATPEIKVSKKSNHIFSPVKESASLAIPELRPTQPDEEFMRMK